MPGSPCGPRGPDGPRAGSKITLFKKLVEIDVLVHQLNEKSIFFSKIFDFSGIPIDLKKLNLIQIKLLLF